ncbi:kelch repeat-containing protein [Myxococcota bacterium]|nr:kelch repeat-containing protein [Myxococcota bacterium]
MASKAHVSFGTEARALALGAALLPAACTSAVDVDVQLVDPCNQSAVQMADFLKFEPRGEGIDSFGLSTTVDVASGSTPAIQIPLASDFQLVVTGFEGDLDGDPIAIGVSAKRDLTTAKDAVSIRVPFPLVDAFYKTTDLETPGECSKLNVGRYGATATYLPDNGKVLVVGGANLVQGTLVYTRVVELYDPDTGKFLPVQELKSGGARAFHTATLLADGRVLIAGGEALVSLARESIKSALIVDARDPNNVTIEETGVMRNARTGHVAARLSDGRVVIAGGRVINSASNRPADQTYLSSIELFDPDRGAFTVLTDGVGQAIELSQARYGHTGTLLKTGFDVMITGGMGASGPVRTIDVVRVQGDTVSVVTSQGSIGTGAIFHAAALAQNGAVLLSGGYDRVEDAEPTTGQPVSPSSTVEMWEFRDSTGELVRACAGAMSAGRGRHTVSIVGRKAVFIGGRGDDGSPLASSEIATLSSTGSCFSGTPVAQTMTDPRAEHSVAELESSGELLVVGGRQLEGGDPFGRSIDGAEVFSPRRDP